MSRYRGPRLRITRRLGFLPGLTTKKSKNINPPGDHGAEMAKKKKRNKLSQYSLGLLEKQKLRFNYGVTERQLFNYVKKARRAPDSSGDVLLRLLEMRLDNIVYRLGMAPTIAAARQLINHGHILVNDERVSFPSYQCKLLDQIKFKTNQNISESADNSNQKKTKLRYRTPRHLQFNYRTAVGTVKNIADRTVVSLKINELLVIEFYSRKF
jgi:small subunit ribosomal protein S4